MPTAPKSPNRKLKRLAYVLGILVFQEVVLRLCFPLPELSNFDRINYMTVGQSSAKPVFLRNGSWFWQSQLDTTAQFVHEMNGYGFRDVEWSVAKPVGKKRVMIVGDSFVEGIMAAESQTIPAAFAAAAGNEVEVMNCGMMGVGISSYLKFVAHAVPIFQPDVVVVVLFANDIPRNAPVFPEGELHPEYYNPWKPRFVEVLQQSANGNPAKLRWSGGAQSYLPALPAPNNPWTKKEAELKRHVTPEIADAMRSGQLNPFRVNQLATEEQLLSKPADFGEMLPLLKACASQNGAELVVCYIPSRHQVTKHYLSFEQPQCTQLCRTAMDLTKPEYQINTQLLRDQCTALGLNFLDLTNAVRTEEQRGNHLYWNYDDHMRGKGYTVLGKTIYQQWSGM